MEKEIKLLKRLQIHQGNRLVDLNSDQQFPEKIKQLMEEKKFNEEKIKDLINKEKQEEAHVLRQESIITMMEGQIESLS